MSLCYPQCAIHEVMAFLGLKLVLGAIPIGSSSHHLTNNRSEIQPDTVVTARAAAQSLFLFPKLKQFCKVCGCFRHIHFARSQTTSLNQVSAARFTGRIYCPPVLTNKSNRPVFFGNFHKMRKAFLNPTVVTLIVTNKRSTPRKAVTFALFIMKTVIFLKHLIKQIFMLIVAAVRDFNQIYFKQSSSFPRRRNFEFTGPAARKNHRQNYLINTLPVL